MSRSNVRIIAQQIEGLIIDQKLGPHDRLPSEREMSEQFGCNRITLRKAVRQLCSEYLLYSMPASGTYVAPRPTERNLWQLLSFTDAISQSRGKVTNQVLEFIVEPAKNHVSKSLKLPLGEEVVLISRLRMINNEPVAIDHTYLPYRNCPGILDHNLEKESLFHLLEEEYGRIYCYGHKEIEVAYPQKWESKRLELAEGEPVLFMRSMSYDQHNQPNEYMEQLARPDKFVLISELSANDEF